MRILRAVAGVTVAAAISWAAFANAQESGTDDEPEPDAPVAVDAEAPAELPEELFQSRVMDEITVISGPQGQSAFELEMRRQALMQEAVYAEMRLRERDREELAWRQADRDLETPESRIKWGYSPQAEQRMRRENDFMYDLSSDYAKPASIFRVEF